MKIGLAVSTADALPSAFVAMRDDLVCCIDRCAGFGYDGVEFALRHPSQVDVHRIKERLAATGLQVPCNSPAARFSPRTTCISLTRKPLFAPRPVERIVDMVRLAAEFA